MRFAAFLPSRKTFVLSGLAAVFLGVAVWWTRGPTDPVFEGRRLSEWLYQSHLDSVRNSRMAVPFSLAFPRSKGGRQIVLNGASSAGNVPFFTHEKIKTMGPDAVIWLGWAVEHGHLPRDAGPGGTGSVFVMSGRIMKPSVATSPTSSLPSAIDRICDRIRQWFYPRSDETYDPCSRAAGILREMGPDALPAMSALLRALDDPDKRRFTAAWSILKDLGEPARSAIRNSLTSGSLNARRRIARELPYVRWFYGRKLDRTEYEMNLRAALAACGDADSEVRTWAAITVAECQSGWGYEPAMEPAIRVLTDGLSNPQERTRVASYLVLFGPHAKPAVPRLLEALVDPDPKFRLEVVKALCRIDEFGAAFALPFRQLLEDEESGIRDCARSYLSRFGGAGAEAKTDR